MRIATKSAIAALVGDIDQRELLDNMIERIESLEDQLVSNNPAAITLLRPHVEQIIDEKAANDSEMALEREQAFAPTKQLAHAVAAAKRFVRYCTDLSFAEEQERVAENATAGNVTAAEAIVGDLMTELSRLKLNGGLQ